MSYTIYFGSNWFSPWKIYLISFFSTYADEDAAPRESTPLGYDAERIPFDSCLHCWRRAGLCAASAAVVNESETLVSILLYISLVISVF